MTNHDDIAWSDSVGYHLDTPGPIWEAWKETVPRNQTLADRLCELMAADALAHHNDLDESRARQLEHAANGVDLDGR